MNHTFCLSSMRTPTGTVATIAVLTAIFILVGLLLAGVAIVEHAAAGPRHYSNAAAALINWMCRTGELV